MTTTLDLRFAKSKFSEKCQEEKLTEIATFMNRVMLPRLGEFFIQAVAVVELPQDQLQVPVHPSSQIFRPIPPSLVFNLLRRICIVGTVQYFSKKYHC